MRLTIKLGLSFGALMMVLVVSSLVAHRQITRIEQDVVQLVEVEEPLEQAVLEMEINAGETARAVLDYIRDLEAEHLKMMRDSEADFERFAAVFKRLAETDEERRLGRMVAELYTEFKLLGDEIVVLADRRHGALEAFRRDVLAIDELIDEKLQKAIDRTAPDAIKKLEAALDMEINIDEAFAAILGYVIRPDPALRRTAVDAEADFERFEALYRETRLSAEERGWLDEIDRDFAKAVTDGTRVMAIVDELNERLERFEEDLKAMDILLDDRIQPLIHAETVRAAEDAKASTKLAALVLLILGGIGLAVGGASVWAISRGVIRPVHTLTRGAELVGQGELDHRIDITGRDEFGHLATAFNRMVENLKVSGEALRESEERFALAMKGTNEGLWDWNLLTDEIYWSPRFLEIVGIAEGEAAMTPEQWRGLIHPEDRELHKRAHTAHLKGEADYLTCEMRVRHTDGCYRWVNVRGFALRSKDDQAYRMAGSIADITARKEGEQQLILFEKGAKNARMRLVEAIETFSEGFAVYDADDRLEICNNHYRDMIWPQYSDLIVRGVRFEAFVRECFRRGAMDSPGKELETFVAEALERHHHVPSTTELHLADGRWIRHSKRRTTDGKRVVCVYADITDSKQREDVLRAAKEEAESANQAKSDFLATMSHEIRTPLNGIIGMAGLMLDTDLTMEQRRFGEALRNSGDVLLTVIGDILDFSKMEAGSLELETLDFDLRNVVETAPGMLASTAREKNIELATFIAPEVPTAVRGDPGRLRQILLNLAGNAIKFTEDGAVSIEVSLDERTERDAVLRFKVIDTGIGIPPEFQPTLFDRFTQADATTARKSGGTGLGLAISKQLAELMDGEIGVDSESGKGSTFWFTVRLGLGLQDPAKRRRVPPDFKRLRVLVVDYTEMARENFARQLESWGMQVELAVDGTSALEALEDALRRRAPFDVVLIDHMMPGMDGEELGRAIRERSGFSSIKLVLITSLGLRGDAVRARKAGFSAYLTRPVHQSVLFNCLVEICGAGAGEAEDGEKDTFVTRHSISENWLGRELCILLAEDNPVNQMFVKTLLKKAGHTVDVVENGAEAVRAVGKGYDLVLMDIHMPEMDGIEATRAIRRLSGEQAGVPIIALTANAMKGDRETYLAAGMTEYVAKPIDTEALTAAIARATGVLVPIADPGFRAPEGGGEGRQSSEAADALGAMLDSLDELDKEPA